MKNKKNILIISFIIVLIILLGIFFVLYSNNQDKKEYYLEKEEVKKEEQKRAKELKELCDNMYDDGWYPSIFEDEGCEDYICYYAIRKTDIYQIDCDSEKIEKFENPNNYTVKEYLESKKG